MRDSSQLHFPGKIFVLVVMDDGTKMAYEMAHDAQGALDQEWIGAEPDWTDRAFQAIYGRYETRISLEGRVVQGKIWKPGDDFIPTEQPSLETPRVALES